MTTDSLATIDVLGGISSRSTVEYHRRIDEGINEVRGGHNAADLLIRSVDFGAIEGYVHDAAWEAAGDHLAEAAGDLEAGGADAVMTAPSTGSASPTTASTPWSPTPRPARKSTGSSSRS